LKRFKHSDDDFDQNNETEPSPFDGFLADGLINRVLYTVKSGKEATVYCCEAGQATGRELLAVKVYLARSRRNFKDDTVYREGRVFFNNQTARAIKKKTKFGREAEFGMWMFHEFETLKHLYHIGADVPEPLAVAENAILMEYFGDRDSAAPLLHQVDLEPDEAKPLFKQILKNVELWLENNIVHGDLSPYNILYWQGELKIIDFPQSVDPRNNRNAFDLLLRDVTNLCDYWAGYGVKADAYKTTKEIWDRVRPVYWVNERRQ
jgi:RIO kinase 1